MYESTPGQFSADISRYRATVAPPTPALLSDLPAGKAGTIATLKHMREFVRAAIRAPDQRIRSQALQIYAAAQVPPRNYEAEVKALHAFVRDRIRYVRDPVGLELVQAPARTLDIGQGDCDDKSTLLAALLMATGHPARFVVIGFRGEPFSHVLVEYKRGPKWIPLETILDGKPVGWWPSGVTSQLRFKL